jgi:hypothetical protein
MISFLLTISLLTIQNGNIHKSYPINSNAKCKCNICFKFKEHSFGGTSEYVNKNSSFDITSYSFHLHIIKPEIDKYTNKVVDGYKCYDKNCSYNVDKVLKDNREKMNSTNLNKIVFP